jgi:hypothetical protein
MVRGDVQKPAIAFGTPDLALRAANPFSDIQNV